MILIMQSRSTLVLLQIQFESECADSSEPLLNTLDYVDQISHSDEL